MLQTESSVQLIIKYDLTGVNSFQKKTSFFRIKIRSNEKLNSTCIPVSFPQITTFAPDKNGKRQIYVMRWGFNIGDELREKYSIPVENIEKDQRFRDDWRSHRCIIPATYFIERVHRKANDGSVTIGDKEYVVQPTGLSHTWICGIYRIEEKLPYCILLTHPAKGKYKDEMNGRIPLILPDSLADEWINPEVRPRDLLQYTLTDFVFEEYDLPKRRPDYYTRF